jgi:hypothetical protein
LGFVPRCFPVAGPVIVYGVSASVLDNDPVLTVGTPVPGCPRTPQERCPYKKRPDRLVKPFENVTDFLLEDPHF